MAKITVHCMVRNEPFVYYAVKSVYDYVDKILIYDTGSNDKYTIKDILQLQDEDTEQKITFKNVLLDYDETPWKVGTCREMAKQHYGQKGTWWARQRMIDETDTEYFLILDGDEIHFHQTISAIRHCVDNWPKDKVCGFTSLIWHLTLTQIFRTSHSGRIFLTKAIEMTKYSPGEMHILKGSKQRIGKNSNCSFLIPNVKPFAHFEKMLKPWRREVEADTIRDIAELPEVMNDYPEKLVRYLNECIS